MYDEIKTQTDDPLQLIVAASQDFFFVFGPKEERFYVSPSFYRATGYTPEEIQSTDFRTRVHPEDLPLVEQTRAENLRGKPTQIEYRARCKDGSYRRLDLRAQPVLDERGEVVRIVCYARDLSAGDRAAGGAASGAVRSRVRVLIVDDHAVLRTGLKMLLSSQSDMEVVGEAADAKTALESALAVDPDVVTLDLTMPDGGGLRLLQSLRRECPRARTLVLTMHDDAAYLRAVLAAGGVGYVTKTADESELLSGIRAVAQGRTYFSLSTKADLAKALGGEAETDCPPPLAAPDRPPLSDREREVLGYVAQGYTNQQVADRMYLSVKTIETYRSRLMAKLGFENRAQLVRFALQSGLLAMDDGLPPDPRRV